MMTADSNKVKYFFLRNPSLSSNPRNLRIFIDLQDLGMAEREIKRVKNGTFVLIPIADQTHGHGTHTGAAVWQ
jgi:hypothetical protein